MSIRGEIDILFWDIEYPKLAHIEYRYISKKNKFEIYCDISIFFDAITNCILF